MFRMLMAKTIDLCELFVRCSYFPPHLTYVKGLIMCNISLDDGCVR